MDQRETALDVLQEIFIDLWLALPKFVFRSVRQFYAFVFLLVRRRLAKYYRQRRVWLEFFDQYLKENYELPDPQLKLLLPAINQLSENYRMLFGVDIL